jgi:hypothetical protein
VPSESDKFRIISFDWLSLGAGEGKYGNACQVDSLETVIKNKSKIAMVVEIKLGKLRAKANKTCERKA